MTSKFFALALAVGAAVLGLAVARVWFAPKPAVITSGTVLPQPRLLNDFTLTGDDGAAFTKTQLQGRWSLIFPGFTHCPDICPTTLATLKAVHAKLAQANAPLNVVFLSVDPERDVPANLARYVQYFNPTFRGVTAMEPELARFTRELGVAYAKSPGATPQTYTMDHSAALVLLNPQVQVAAYFSPPFAADTLSADLLTLIKP